MRHGYRVVRQDLKAVGLMWLIMFGINLVVLLLAFPLVLLFLVTGGLAGGATLLIVRGLVGLFASGATPWVIGALIGGPIFFLVLFAPLALVGGLHQTFDSTDLERSTTRRSAPLGHWSHFSQRGPDCRG